MKRILTGDRPTGPLHIGHYFGSLVERVKLQDQYETYVLIADVQALTDNFDAPQKVHDNIIEVTLDNLAAGIDPNKSTIVIQSKLPAIADLTIFFMNLVTVARVGRNPTVKEEIKQKGFGESLPFGFYAYPVSQAADILAFNADLVPVGDDQLPMIEMTREIARDFNRIYGQVFVEPEAKVGSFGRIKGFDGNAKMSKSLNNSIELKDSEEETAKKIMSAYTDPAKARKDDPGHPDGCIVHSYHQIFTSGHAAIKEECLKGGRGCVVCKKELIANMNAYFAPIRQKRIELGNDLGYVRNVLKQGIIKGQEVTGDILEKAKMAMKIDYRDILG
ncbi:tryptophan--tRNA ligase [candidate division TA06 bacterium]|uniref:Tryptophan--tRNA ligase n=1 Tax=candidate division TA06 bacterium TaxID=2250710 RepID=A0A933I7J7_UNCT6|nr:tryptophan--tRNA ligase [candidate division TA06 bacterium]